MRNILKVYRKNTLRPGDLVFVLILLISFLSVFSLFHSGLPPTHDGEYHVVRFYEFDKTLKDGNWYPLWAADLNFTFGSPLFDYVYPLPNYIASFFHVFGLNFIDSFKANLICASILGGVFAFLLGKRKFGSWGGLLTSVFYTYAPYHFLDIYIRGSVGEVWALAFFPAALYCFDLLSEKKTSINLVLASISYALVIFSHNILAVMFSAFLGTYLLLLMTQSTQKKRSFLFFSSAVALGLMSSAVFFLPALFEENFVVGLKVFQVTQNFPELFQLIVPSWGSGFSGGDLSNQMSFQIGLANLLVVAVVGFAFLTKKIKKNKLEIFLLLLWFFFLLFLITPFSTILWDNLPLMNYFQFPWRFLSLVILCTALLAGSLASIYKSKIIFITLLVFVFITTYSYAKPPYFLERGDSYYMSRDNFIHGTNSIGDAFQTKWLPQQKNIPRTINSKNIRLVMQNSTTQTYTTTFEKPQEIVLDTAFFPGWTAYIDNKKGEAENKNGAISVRVPEGKHTLKLTLEDTNIRLFSKAISILTILFLMALFLKGTVIQLFYAHRD